MQKQNTKYIKIFLCIDIVLSIIMSSYVAFAIYETKKYMYFAGFVIDKALFYNIASMCSIVVIINSIKKKNTNDCCIDIANSLLFRMVIDSVFTSFRYFVV